RPGAQVPLPLDQAVARDLQRVVEIAVGQIRDRPRRGVRGFAVHARLVVRESGAALRAAVRGGNSSSPMVAPDTSIGPLRCVLPSPLPPAVHARRVTEVAARRREGYNQADPLRSVTLR